LAGFCECGDEPSGSGATELVKLKVGSRCGSGHCEVANRARVGQGYVLAGGQISVRVRTSARCSMYVPGYRTVQMWWCFFWQHFVKELIKRERRKRIMFINDVLVYQGVTRVNFEHRFKDPRHARVVRQESGFLLFLLFSRR
jgi:hypothetical protein